MKKYLVLALILMLPLVWAWSAEEDVKTVADNAVKPLVETDGIAISPVKEGNLLDSTNPIPEPPVIATNIITQDFEETWDPTTPPTGWTIIDNGSDGQQNWYNQDWHKYYYSSSGFADTVARVYYSPNMEEQYDEWLITSDVVLPGGATACSLTFKTYYNDYSTAVDRDSAFILISSDGGTNWDRLDAWDSDQGSSTSPLLANYDITSYAGQTVRAAFQVKTFGYVGYLGMYYWYLDNVAIWSDGSALLNEDFNNWGDWGDNPPTGWSIIDGGTPKPASGWDNNDWYKYTAWSSGTARVYYTSSAYEWQDEWLISPTFAISSGVACTLSVAEYFYVSTTYEDQHGYIKVSTDGGSTWPYTIEDHTTTLGSSSTKNYYSYSLDAFVGESNVAVAFNFTNIPYGYDYWYIDDVSIDEYVPPSEDAGVASIDEPLVLDYTNVNHTIVATIENLLADSTIIDSIEFKVEDSTPAVVFGDTTYPGTYILGYASQQFSSGTPWNPSVEDWYTVTVTFWGSGDGFAGNNSLSATKIMKDVRTYPYLEDMEVASAGDLPMVNFILSGTSGGVFWTSSYSHSPTHCVYFSYSPYPRETAMVFPPVAITSATMPMLEFFEATYLTWWGDAPDQQHTVAVMSGDFDLDNLDTLWTYNPGDRTPWDRGDFSNAPPIRLDMSPYIGDTVWVVMDYHEPTIDGSYWYLDDVALREWPQDDIAATSIDAPAGDVVLGGTVVSPMGTFTNLGIIDQTIDAIFTVEDTASAIVSVIYADTVTGVVVDSGGSYQVTFADWAIPGADNETYTLTLEAVNPGDENTDDNINTSSVTAYTHYNNGGPDDFGYRWIDNISIGDEDPPVYGWIDITTVGNLITWQTGSVDDGRSIYGMDLPGGFWYYGNYYDSVCIGTNGWMALVNQTSNYLSNYEPPSASGPRTGIFPNWDDLDGGTVGSCYYYPDTTNNRFIVSWVNWPYYPDPTNPCDFQVILNLSDSSIVMQYGPATDGAYQTDITVGIQDSAYSSGLAYYYNGTTNPGNYPFEGLAIKYYFEPPAIDVSVDNFTDTPTSGLAGVGINPSVQFSNGGTDPANNVPVRLTITPGTYDDPQTITVLGSGVTDTVDFSTFTPTAGFYTLTAVNEFADGDPSNDTLTQGYFAYNTLEDFEADNGGLAGNNDWQWGTPTSGPGSAYSGVNVWATILGGNYNTSTLSTLGFQLSIGAVSGGIGVASWYDTEASWDGGNFAVSTDGGATWDVISPDVGYSGVANSSNPIPTGDSIFTGHNQGFWEYISFDLSAYAGMTVDARFAFGSDASVTYPGWYLDDLALVNCTIVTPDIDVTPLAVSGAADPLGVDYDTITVSNNGDGQLNFTAEAFMDETFTNLRGERVPLYSGETHLDIRRGPSAFLAISNPVINQQGIEERKAQGIVDRADEGMFVPDSYVSPVNPLPIIALDIAYENFDDGLLPSGWSIVDGGNTTETWMPQSSNTCSRSGTYLFTDWFTVDSDCKLVTTDTLDEQLLTGYYDLSTYSPVRLAFGSNFQKYASYGDSGYVEVRNGSTGTWNLLKLFDYDLQSYEDFDITTLIGAGDSVQVRFHYMDRGDLCWYWMIDDFLLYEPDTPWLSIDTFSGSIPPLGTAIDIEVTFDAEDVGPGIYTGHVDIASNDPDEASIVIPATFIVGGLGTVSGQVTDANTTNAIEGAVVTATWVSSTVVVDTTDAGGNYSILITPGTVTVGVEAVGYVGDSQDVVVVADQTTTHDVALTAPIATIDQSDIIDTVTIGDTAVYGRYLYNTGTAPLTYSVALDFSGGGPGINVQNNSKSERIMSVLDPTGSADAAPFFFNNGSLPVITDFQDSVFVLDCQGPTGDDGCLGMEFDGTYFWVTGRNAALGDIHKLHKFDANGNYMLSYDQGTTSTWGWRDMAWDGAYLYASDENEWAKIDPATGAKVDTLQRPAGMSPLRALAYNPDNDHFYAANFGSSIIEFDRTGTISNTWANTKAIYGLAFDNLSEGGPFLWVNSQDGTPQMQISQFRLSDGMYTGVTWQSALPDGHTAALAGGACFTTEWDASIGALFVLGQGTPTDFIYGYEIATNITWFKVLSGGSGDVAVGDSALIEFMADFRDTTIVADSTYEGDANINNNDPYSVPVIHFAITAEAGGCDYVVGDVNGSDNYNGLDITYGVNFFKYGSPVPQCTECPLCPDFYYCGDVNNSCNYNGLDITYGVNYFKYGSPAPQPCDQCPPIGPASVGNDDLKPAIQDRESKSVAQPTIETKSNSKKGNELKR